jgi:Group II intron, maturase-specific domain
MTEMVTSGLMRGCWRRSDGPLEGDTRPKWGETAGPRTPWTPPRQRPTLLRLTSRTPAGARQALKRTGEVLAELGLRLSQRKTKLVTLYQGVDFLGYRLVSLKGHLNVYISPKALVRFRAEVRRLTRRTAGKSLRAVVSRLDRYVRGWGEYFKRAQASGVLDRHDCWITRRLRSFMAKRWRNGLWRRYPDEYFWVHLGLTRLYHLRRDFIRELEARRRAGNRSVERSARNSHATFVRGTEALP